MEIVIPYKLSQDGIELRYMLRSVEKHFRPYYEEMSYRDIIYLIGDKPSWAINLNHLPHPNEKTKTHKEYNIFMKLVVGCNITKGRYFVMMHDDHFLLRDMPATVPNYYEGTLGDKLKTVSPETAYGKTLINTIEHLDEHAYNFDMHCPMLIKKKWFLQLNTNVDLNLTKWNEYGYCIKTLYMNLHNGDIMRSSIKPFAYTDLKLREPTEYTDIKRKIEGRLFFSTDSRHLTPPTIKLLQELYPNKSKYESD